MSEGPAGDDGSDGAGDGSAADRDAADRAATERDAAAGDAGTPRERPRRKRPATAQERDRPGGKPWSRRPRRHRRGPEDGPKKRRPERLGGFLERLLEKWGIAGDVERAGVVADWDEIVGEETARRTRPAGVRGSTLFVEVESASWMQELNMMRHQILRRINAGREKGRVEKIVFLQAGRSEGSESPRDRKGRD